MDDTRKKYLIEKGILNKYGYYDCKFNKMCIQCEQLFNDEVPFYDGFRCLKCIQNTFEIGGIYHYVDANDTLHIVQLKEIHTYSNSCIDLISKKEIECDFKGFTGKVICISTFTEKIV